MEKFYWNCFFLHILTVKSLLYSSILSFVEAMKSPPLLFHPGLTPDSSSIPVIMSCVSLIISISVSDGRSLQTKPEINNSSQLDWNVWINVMAGVCV